MVCAWGVAVAFTCLPVNLIRPAPSFQTFGGHPQGSLEQDVVELGLWVFTSIRCLNEACSNKLQTFLSFARVVGLWPKHHRPSASIYVVEPIPRLTLGGCKTEDAVAGDEKTSPFSSEHCALGYETLLVILRSSVVRDFVPLVQMSRPPILEC